MTKEQINMAIAQACGWKKLLEYNGAWGRDLQRTYLLPDYCNDLNAMHEAEKVLTEPQQSTYAQLLHAAHKRHYLLADFCVAHATAAQRAEAFLRTINKWEG
jgi:hypothetical protein